MEFCTEMIVKAIARGLPVCEVPTKLARDGRNRPSHLRSWPDGWRMLRLLMRYRFLEEFSFRNARDDKSETTRFRFDRDGR